MYTDIDSLENRVMPNLKHIGKYLTLTSDALSSINIPSDFCYGAKLKNLKNTVKDIDYRVRAIVDWVIINGWWKI